MTNTTPHVPLQFSLRTVLLIPVVLAVAISVGKLVGWGWVFLFFGVLITFGPWPRGASPRIREGRAMIGTAISALSLMTIIVWLVIPADVPHRRVCRYDLRRIGEALHTYHNTYGSFPPAYVADDEGRPMHSWRVLLLPFLEEKALYDRYRFDEPWNGPNNIKLVDEIPRVFQCPSNRAENKNCMNYLAVIGPQTAWPGASAVSIPDITDGASNTWFVVEVADSGIAWSEPRDLHVLQMSREINPIAGQGISSKHPGGAQVLYVDGNVDFIRDATNSHSCGYAFDPDEVHAALTINGGERVKRP